MENHAFKLPEGFLLGTATASTQVEGSCTTTNWYDWYRRGHIKDHSSPDNADQHWRLWREDVDLMASMGIQAARIGIEWARVEPARGEFDEQAYERYRQELSYMREKGIMPLLTLWHFSNPMWFEEKGAFLQEDAREIFREYAEKTIEEVGDLAESWVTINEPNVYAFNGYFMGAWPPGRKSFSRTVKVLDALADCHITAYQLIHAKYPDAKVGFAQHVRVFEPLRPGNLWHKACCAAVQWLFQDGIQKVFCTGRKAWPYRSRSAEGTYYDYLGMNYYSRSVISGIHDGVMAGTAKNDLHWEIYPDGIRAVAEKFFGRYQKEIWITENGTCDNQDAFRSRYIYEHLRKLLEAKAEVARYYHWSLMDNWEWLEGESARFGLVHVDYGTQKRTLNKSGKLYAEIIARQGVSEEMYERYVRGEAYHVE